jgi:hypothetical protein
MNRLATVLSVLLVLAGMPVLSAQAPRPAFPSAPPPAFVLVAGVDRDKGTIRVQLPTTVFLERTEVRLVERNGKKVTESAVVPVAVTQIKEIELSLKMLRVLDVDAKEVQGEELWKRLTPGKMVLQQSGLQPVDAAYRRVLARDALILTRRGGKAAP